MKKFLSIGSLAIIGALLLLPVSPLFAAIYFVGTLTSPFWGKFIPSNILGENPPPVTEKDLLEKIKKNVDASVLELKGKVADLETKSVKELTDKITALEKKSTEIKELKDVEAFKTVSTELDKLTLEMKSIKEESKKPKVVGSLTMKAALMAALEEKSVKAQFAEVIAAGGVQKAPIYLTLKAVDTISIASTIDAGTTQNSITENTGLISPIRKRELRYIANVSVGSIGTNRAYWIEETDEEGTPIMLAEAATKTQLDVQYVEQTTAVKKIAVFGKVTTELMADIPQLISFIQMNLMKRMDIVLEDQLFSGDGVGDNLNGAITQATAFTGASLALAVDEANEYDVIVAIALQSEVAFGMPNCVFVNPGIIAKMRLLKATTGEYLIPRGTPDDMLQIAGMRVVGTTAVGADVFLGGDCSVIRVLNRSDIGIQIGLDGNDFTQNKKTMLMEKRVAQYISANDTATLITGDFTTAKAALETV